MKNNITCISDVVRVADPFMAENANAKFGLRLHQRTGCHGVTRFNQLKRYFKAKSLCSIGRDVANRRST